jgi:nucleotide-binding universal stress UspA family protein
VLVALDGSRFSETATALAIDWALRLDARLVGLGVLDEPTIDRPEPVPMGAGAYKIARDEARLTEAHQRILAFLAGFRARCASANVAAEVLEDVGDPADRILREAQRCDVVVLGRETNFHFETQDEPDATALQILRSTPRPVVIVPSEMPEGRGVMVAYDGSREAGRALQLFELLGLTAGDEVVVVGVHAEAGEAEALLRPAGEFLAAHGAHHRLDPVASEAPAAKVLLAEVRRLRPRVLVMGAHRDHLLRDLFATSVSRAVLAACPVPVFVGA